MKYRSPVRLHISSVLTSWNVTVSPIALANAPVMITSDRQLPWRASNASAALRVIDASYSSCSLLRVYSASVRPARRPRALDVGRISLSM